MPLTIDLWQWGVHDIIAMILSTYTVKDTCKTTLESIVERQYIGLENFFFFLNRKFLITTGDYHEQQKKKSHLEINIDCSINTERAL